MSKRQNGNDTIQMKRHRSVTQVRDPRRTAERMSSLPLNLAIHIFKMNALRDRKISVALYRLVNEDYYLRKMSQQLRNLKKMSIGQFTKSANLLIEVADIVINPQLLNNFIYANLIVPDSREHAEIVRLILVGTNYKYFQDMCANERNATARDRRNRLTVQPENIKMYKKLCKLHTMFLDAEKGVYIYYRKRGDILILKPQYLRLLEDHDYAAVVRAFIKNYLVIDLTPSPQLRIIK